MQHYFKMSVVGELNNRISRFLRRAHKRREELLSQKSPGKPSRAERLTVNAFRIFLPVNHVDPAL
jgi:hypothetical protein